MGKESARPQGANSGAVANNAETTEKKIGGVTGKGFKPGQSGNPTGRPKSTPITDALRKALANPKQAEAFVKGILKEARKGNSKAFAAVADRLEGKPAQSHELTGKDGRGIVFTLRRVGDPIEEIDA